MATEDKEMDLEANMKKGPTGGRETSSLDEPLAREMTFEEAITRLEAVVRELEDGRLPLEKALELFAEGIRLSRICGRHLEEAEQRICILTEDEKGGITLREVDTLPSTGGGNRGGL